MRSISKFRNEAKEVDFIPRRGMKMWKKIDLYYKWSCELVSQEKMQAIILSYPESQGLPEKVIANIVNIALAQNKEGDKKWILKMLSDAQKKHQQALAAKALKDAKKQTADIFTVNRLINKKIKTPVEAGVHESDTQKKPKKKFDEPLFQKDPDEHLLPYVEDLRSLYPKLKNSAYFYILHEFGIWPLRLMAIFPDRDRLFPQWTIQAAATLKDVGLKKILELGLDKDPDVLYRFLKREAGFYDNYYHRIRYKKHIKSKAREYDQKKEAEVSTNEKKEVDSL